MALIKCSECGRQISDKAGKCPVCGNPIGSDDDSTGNIAFEKRIEEYKKAGYILRKRDGDTVKLHKLPIPNSKPVAYIVLAFTVLFSVAGFFLIFANFILGLFIMIFPHALLYSAIGSYSVNISLTKTGKIEETGNVLKNK